MNTKQISITILIGLVWAGAVAGAERAGRVISVEGQAVVQNKEGQDQKLILNSEVFLNDRVKTSDDSKLQLMMVDEAIISLGENSEMTIDEYTYSPQVKKDNKSALGLVRGMFRVITAKITDHNPEQFKVKSNLATIGIRGCELAFLITPDREEIQIVRVPADKEIVITSNSDDSDRLKVKRQGVRVDVDPLSGLKRRPLTAQDIKRIYDATTPLPSVAQLSTEYEVIDSEMALAVREPLQPSLEMAMPAAEIGAQANALATEAQLNTALNSVIDEPLARIPLPEPEPAPESAAIEVANTQPTSPSTTLHSTPPGVDPDPDPDPDPVDPPPPPRTFPIVGDVVDTPQGGGTDWSWGTWAQTDIVGEENGVDVTETEFGVEMTGNELSPAEFQALAQNGFPRILTGTGIAAASLNQGSNSRLMSGTGDIQLLIGGNMAPTWDGTFALNSGQGDSLAFDANGVLDGTSGSLTTSANGYSLDAYGAAYGAGSLTVDEINTRLVGNGGDVTGSTGDFRFEHGAAGPAVDGVFGSDLN